MKKQLTFLAEVLFALCNGFSLCSIISSVFKVRKLNGVHSLNLVSLFIANDMLYIFISAPVRQWIVVGDMFAFNIVMCLREGKSKHRGNLHQPYK